MADGDSSMQADIDQPDGTPEDRGDYVEPQPEQGRGATAGGNSDGQGNQQVSDQDAGQEGQDTGQESQESQESQEGQEGQDDENRGNDFIPRYRYNQVAERNKELQRELEQLRNQQQQPAEQQQPAPQQQPDQGQQTDRVSEIDSRLNEIVNETTQAMNDGDTQTMQQLMQEQQQLQNERTEQLLTQTTQQSQQQTQQEIEYDREVERLENELPMLNRDNQDVYDANLEQHIVLLRDAFENQGYAPAQAVRMARQQADPLIQQSMQQYQAAQQQNQQPAQGQQNQQGQQRTQQQRQRNAQDAQAQPPEQSVGDNSTDRGPASTQSMDPMQLSEEEFEALPESTLRQMRGD